MLHGIHMLQTTQALESSSRAEEKIPTPPTHLTYPRDIFILGLFDHGNERRPVTWREEPPPQQISAPLPVACVGLRWIRSEGWGHVALSHRSSSALQTCKPKLLALTKSNICQEDQTTTPRRGGRLQSFSGSVTKQKVEIT